MKITIYELLGMIKDGKAPKKIKVTGTIYYFDEEFEFYFTERENMEVALGGVKNDINLLFNSFDKDIVEILEEKKKIPEKLTPFEAPFLKNDKPDIRFRLIIDKINDICDYLNSKGE